MSSYGHDSLYCNFFMFPIELHGFLDGFVSFEISLEPCDFICISSSSWCFLNQCLLGWNHHFQVRECMCNVNGLQFVTCSLTKFLKMLFACTLKFWMNES
jgi:hypothetical protein